MNAERIKLISLNIERDWHYDRVLPFLKMEQPDVVCLQEVLDRDVERFKRELRMSGIFAPGAIANKGRGTQSLAKARVCDGNAIFTSLPVLDACERKYCGCSDSATVSPESIHWHKLLLAVRLRKGENTFTVATTHFTWTPDGQPDDAQRRDLKALLRALEQFPDIVLCGDFNAPRGREIWTALAARYRDNIPSEYTTSLDQKLHMTPGLRYVVDGLFTTPYYRCSQTRLQCNVSDHCAIVSIIERIG